MFKYCLRNADRKQTNSQHPSLNWLAKNRHPFLFDAVIGGIGPSTRITATRPSIQGPVASVMLRAAVCWLASLAAQLLQICLPSAWCCPSKCWVSNERQHRAAKSTDEKKERKREKKGTERRETQQRCKQILMRVPVNLNMKTLCGVLQRYPCIYVFKVLD